MDAKCASCGDTFDAKRATARYCSGRCRKRAADARGRAPVVQLAPAITPDVISDRGIGAALVSAFTPEDLATPTGQIAVKIASDVDHSAPGMPGIAALIRELRGVLADLSAASAPAVANPLTLIRERHARERASG